MKYRVYGLILDSQEPWAELEPADAPDRADIRISMEPTDAWPPPLAAGNVAANAESEDAWPTIEHDGPGYRLSFGDDAAFWVAADGGTIQCFPGSLPATTLSHFLLDHVLPRTLHLRGLNPLHATAVATTAGVLAFLGKTGTGKSTLAAALGRRGASLMSDDCLVLHREGEAIIATPSYAGLRLYDDVREALFPRASSNEVAHYSDKQRIATAVPLASEPQVLRAVFALERIEHLEAPELTPLGPADATMTLASAAFRIDTQRREQNRQQLGFFAEVVRRVPVQRCVFGEDLAQVDVLAAAILTHVPRAAG